MSDTLVCWKCGAPVDDLPLPLSRYAECSSCRAELHVCRMCRFYDTGVAKHCREPIAEEVKDKGRANFCDYFEARPGAYQPRDQAAADQARDQLNDLFGGGSGDGAPNSLDDLFGGKPKP